MALKHRFLECYSTKTGPVTVWNEESKKRLRNFVSENDAVFADKNAFRFITIICILIVLIFTFSYITILRKPRTELVVVSVNDVGEARFVGNTRGIKMDDYGMRENCVKNILSKYIWNTYNISKDSDLMYENFKNTLYFLDSKKRKSYMRMINSEDPFSDVGRIKRTTEIETIIPISKSSYQADFFIKECELTGYGEKVKKMRGIFSLAQLDTEGYTKLTDEERGHNPLAIYITDYNIVEVK